MSQNAAQEFWLRGPVEGIPALLQPVAHALLQAQDEIHNMMMNIPEKFLWIKPGGKASPAFHLQHIAGVLDRMATYAEKGALSEKQLEYLQQEGEPDEAMNAKRLLKQLDDAIQSFINLLMSTDPSTLSEFRTVGRKQLPSTKIGLLFHAAEHTMRHTGQLMITLQWLNLSGLEPQ